MRVSFRKIPSRVAPSFSTAFLERILRSSTLNYQNSKIQTHIPALKT